VLLVAMGAAAQDAGPYSYLAEYQVQPGKSEEFVESIKKYTKPMFDGLVEEGAMLAWGLDARIIHEEDTATHMLWWVTRDLAGMERFRQAVDLNKHHDHLTRNIYLKGADGEPSGPTYTYWWFVRVKPGHSSDWRKLFDKYNKPVLDQMVEDGTVYGYGIDVEWVHTSDPGWRAIWVVTDSMGAWDKIGAAFRAAGEDRSEEERRAIGQMFRKATKGGDHRDSLWRSIPMDDME
jgi:hypothetical protein